MIRSAVFVVAFAMALAACGKNPNSPSNYAQISGSWTGNLKSNNWADTAVNVFLSQTNDTVSGTWASGASDWNGTITGTVSKTSFTGTFSISAPRVGGGSRCTGTSAISGPATTGGNTLTWTGAGFTGDCNGMPVGVTFNLQR